MAQRISLESRHAAECSRAASVSDTNLLPPTSERNGGGEAPHNRFAGETLNWGHDSCGGAGTSQKAIELQVKNDRKSSEGTANGNSKSSPEDIQKDFTEEKPVRARDFYPGVVPRIQEVAPQILEVVPHIQDVLSCFLLSYYGSKRGIILTRSCAVRRGWHPKVKNDRKNSKGTANGNSKSSPEDMQKASKKSHYTGRCLQL